MAKIKGLTDQLAVIVVPVSDKDVDQQVLNGLGLEFKMLCIASEFFPTLPTFEELKAKLFQYEIRYAFVTHQKNMHDVMFTSTLVGSQREATYGQVKGTSFGTAL